MTKRRHQRTFFLKDRVERTIDELKHNCPAEGYHLADSFGKDSTALRELARMAGVKYDAHFYRSGVDPAELIRYGKEEHPETVLDKAPMSLFDIILEEGIPPTRIMRFCCRLIKEERGAGRVVLTGIRAGESENRAKNRKPVEQCPSQGKMMVNPMLEWQESEVWDFIHEYELPYSPLYDEEFDRLGCIMCPNAYFRTRLREAIRWPKIFWGYMRCFDRLVTENERSWKTGEEVMRWWLEEHRWKDRDAAQFQDLLSLPLKDGSG